jgi:hypothetical protein
MKEICLEILPADTKQVGSQAFEVVCEHEILPNTIVRAKGTNEILLVYGRFEQKHLELKSICRAIKFSKHRRLTQLINDYERPESVDIAFGSRPPNPVFGLAASQCIFNKSSPNWYSSICGLGAELETLYAKHEPIKHAKQKQVVSDIHEDWRLPKTSCYTQGVLNDANVLGYHFDRDNVPNGFSAMAYFKRHVTGGNLVLPQLNAKLICEDETYVLFDGQSLLHAVTPILKGDKKSSYRYSFVFYARQSMVGLESFERELEKTKKKEMELRFRKINEHANKPQA